MAVTVAVLDVPSTAHIARERRARKPLEEQAVPLHQRIHVYRLALGQRGAPGEDQDENGEDGSYDNHQIR